MLAALISMVAAPTNGRADCGENESKPMNSTELLAREWVEIREESDEKRIVLRPITYNVPPARGRRRLDLSEPGGVAAKSPNAADKMISTEGTWTYENGELHIEAPGWSGIYQVEELSEDILVIVPK